MTKSKKYIVFAVQMVAAAVLVFVDQWLKKLAVEHLMGKEDIILIKNFIGFSYAENTGAAFSMFSDNTMALSVVTLILLVGGILAMLFMKPQGKLVNICAVLIIAGGAGNLIDRFANAFVVDYIKTLFIDFPVFNFADILVVVGCFVLSGYLIFDIIKEEIEKKRAKSDGNS